MALWSLPARPVCLSRRLQRSVPRCDAGVLSINGSATSDGASTVSGTVAIGVDNTLLALCRRHVFRRRHHDLHHSATQEHAWLSRNRRPGTWDFDIFLDHYNGNGRSIVRSLHVFFAQVVQRGRVFYDLNCYLRGPIALGVVTDVVELSNNC